MKRTHTRETIMGNAHITRLYTIANLMSQVFGDVCSILDPIKYNDRNLAKELVRSSGAKELSVGSFIHSAVVTFMDMADLGDREMSIKLGIKITKAYREFTDLLRVNEAIVSIMDEPEVTDENIGYLNDLACYLVFQAERCDLEYISDNLDLFNKYMFLVDEATYLFDKREEIPEQLKKDLDKTFQKIVSLCKTKFYTEGC